MMIIIILMKHQKACRRCYDDIDWCGGDHNRTVRVVADVLLCLHGMMMTTTTKNEFKK